MDDFVSLAEKRRSTREFSQESLEFADIIDAVRAATYAPSAGDLQPWKFILLTSDDKRKRVGNLCPQQDWLHDAPLIVIVCSEQQRSRDFYGDNGSSWASKACAAATQNLLLAATDRGLGSCWVGSFDPEGIREALEIPDGVVVEAVVAIGVAGGSPEPKRVDPLHSQVYFNSFGTVTEDMDSALNDWGEHYRKKGRRVKGEVEAQTLGTREKAKDRFSRFKAKVKDVFKRD